MSIRANPTKAVSALLNRLNNTIQTHKRVSSAEDISKIDELIHKLMDTTPVKQWDEKLLDLIMVLDRHHRKIKGADFTSILEDLTQIYNLVRNLQTDQSQEENCLKALSPLEKSIINDADNPIVKSLRVTYDFLDSPNLRICLLFLAIFPENAILKKRLLIYWWIGEGLVRSEEEGEKIFQELSDLELIIPHRTDNLPMVKRCQIHPWIRYMLITVAIRQELLHLDNDGIPRFYPRGCRRTCLIADPTKLATESELETLRTIFNVSEGYLSFKPEWLAKLKGLVVLQLGRWQVSAAHHIEVQRESFLQGLKTQKHLKYLSLRGISRITSLPSSIAELASLEILDLHACHNLEKLPDNIAPLKKLTHLDVSKCYLLERMPKGLDKLTSLQVLKGFIIGNSQKTSCRIEHLRSLEKLERLSMHIGNEAAVIPNKGFENLKCLEKVRSLKISWSVVRKEPVPRETLSFPPSLEKLDLESVPHEWMPELKPSQLGQLKKLYIKGGKLASLYHDEIRGKWNVEILLLKYTKNLAMDLNRIKQIFPSLKHVKKVERKKNREADMGETSGEESDCEWSEACHRDVAMHKR